MDVLDLSVRWNYGVGHRLEAYGSVVVSRAVTVSGRSMLFVPPVDIIVPDGAPIPSRPYYPLYAPIPYVNRTGTSQLRHFVPGDLGVGGKMRLLGARGWRPAVAVSGELKLPLTRDLSELQAGSGTGSFDQTLRITGEWRHRGESLVSSVAFTRVGKPPFGDRVIVVGPGGASQRRDEPLRLADQVFLGLALRHMLSPRAALVAELTRVVAVGGRSRAFYEAGPFDLTIGGQIRWGRFHVTLGVRYHANSAPRYATHPWPLVGLADMTSVSQADLQSYLAAIGDAGALAYIRDRAQIAVQVPANGPPLPDGARVLDSDYTVRSHGRLSSVFVWGWSFGRSRKH